ncbi:reductase AKOR2 [Pleurotus eryngii]|uniref:Reductase AKOR2 n=1 Tax=Pleurotus eryngii TaxID=5323 RepID=A0A9P6D8S9_PLEER|nr:reductase AKOR2 [Pleurotus eryngii]
MSSGVPILTLNNGVKIPAIGLGGWGGFSAEERAAARGWFLTGLQAGYRHIDVAQMYGTEEYLGKAIRESGIPREEIFVTTKLPWNHHSRVAQSFQESLKNLGLDYVDLYLVHWPQRVVLEEGNDFPKHPDGSIKTVESPSFNEVWADVEKLLDTGKVRAIGVSNFSVKTLETLLGTAKVVPAVNQVELHPYLAQPDLVEYCKNKGILITAYTPTGYQNVLTDPTITELAGKYGVSPAQIVLAWHVARGGSACPKSSNVERQKQNINLPTLDAPDVARITALDKGQRLSNKADENGRVWGVSIEELGW